MKKTITIIILLIAVLLLVATNTNAMTKAELKNYLLGEHLISGQKMQLTSAEKKQVEDFFMTHEITDEQADFIKQKAEECKAIMTKAGVTQVQNLSKADKKTLLLKGQEAAEKVGLTVDMSTGLVTDPKTGEPVFKLPEGKLAQTGNSSVGYIVLAVIAIVAVAGAVIYKRKKA